LPRSDDYRCPPQDAKDSTKLGWLQEAVQDGRSFLRSQRPYQNIDQAIDEISGLRQDKFSKKLSKVWVNRPKREIREVIDTLSNLRDSWRYDTDNNKWHSQATKLTKLKTAWWFSTFADMSIKEALAWSAVQGTGYSSPWWDKDFHCRGRGDIALSAYGPENVLPIQIPRDGDWQKAYAVIIWEEVPIHLAHRMYPTFADKIKADRDSPGWLAEAAKRVKRYASSFLNFAGPRSGDEDVVYPTCDKFTVYILDSTINNTGNMIPMGEPGTSWSYNVPSIGMDLPTGFKDPATGQLLSRKATPDDCLLYPLRRLMIGFTDCIVYDDTSTWWHGMVPLIPFKLDEWPFELLGYSLLRDISGLNAHSNSIRRAVEDSINARLSPPCRGTQSELTAKADLEKFDPRIPTQMIQLDTPLTGEEPIKPILPYQHYEVPAAAFEYIKDLQQEEGYLIGVQDFTNLAKARQVPSGDAQEKLLQMIGPLMEARTRSIERSVSALGQMWKALAFQFYTVTRREQILGQAGIADEDIDWEPGDMVPSHVEGEDEEQPSRYSKIERLRWHINNFHTRVVPYSITGMASMQRKLLEIQLSKIPGFPFDPWTVGERLDVDMGPVLPDPETGKIPQTRVERFITWQKLLVGLEVEKMAEAQKVAQELGINPEAMAGAGGKGQQQRGRGRPPTNETAPRLETKEGGARATIATSK
jgi:hypothetical protein